ncbi:MAG: 3-phosphoshikimate 1-carboxyvinyltransferase [Pseudomonadota bacterium]
MSAEPEYYCQPPQGGLRGSMSVPGDKSISHRALLLGSLARGQTKVTGLLEAEDVKATGVAMQALGSQLVSQDDHLCVLGADECPLSTPVQPLDMGNSGTGIRLLTGLLAGQGLGATLTGDDSLRSRPMGRIIRPLSLMGVDIRAANGGRAPLEILPAGRLRALRYEMPVASAQLKSCLLLAGLGADGPIELLEPAPSRDHTESMLRAYGVTLASEERAGERWLRMEGGQALTGPQSIHVPGDFSSAAFFLVAGSIRPESDLTLTNVGINPMRTGLLDLLREMGASIDVLNPRESGGEPVADLRVRSATLRGVDVDPRLVPLMIDEFPVAFIAAAVSEGVTRVRGAEELRVKESDRLAVMAEGLRTLGVVVTEYEDGIDIIGQDTLGGGTVHGQHDHRCAMSFAVASLRAQASVTVQSVANVATSFPDFRASLNALGGHVEEREGPTL